VSKIVFIGFMGAGKSTAARAAAQALGERCVDSDEELERRAQASIAEFFSREGEGAFRALEERVVLELLGDRAGPRVVSLGGGAVGCDAVRRELEDHLVVWVDIDVATAWERVRDTERPLARVRERFEALHAAREPRYRALADIVLPAQRSADAGRALCAWEGVPRGTRMLWAASDSGDYPVLLAYGLLTQRGFWPPWLDGRRVLVSDRQVAERYCELLEPLHGRVVVTGGERSKTVAQAELIWSELARLQTTRADLVVALGGGVVGDLAGFCAATYQRGVRWVGVPTSLVAQVDSAYGGKTGVDLEQAKNYVGAYHQPSAVLVDPAMLATLPGPELAAGYAEVLKTALIAGGELWERVRAGADPADAEVICACALTKLRIVAADERDGGPRQVLNLGHTVGHAIETATGYARYRHGEAVALGLLAALRLSGLEDLRREVASLLAARGLPVGLLGVDPDDVLRAIARDKKRLGSGPVRFVLLDGPGRPRCGCEVRDGDLSAAVRELTLR
jgi:shikimate kinase/3-dehydroquinate synthase